MNTVKKTNGILCILLIGMVTALYGQFLSNPLVFDDVYFFRFEDSGAQPISTYRFAWFELRSLPYATLAWTKAMYGLDLINFRIGNLLLHSAVVLALFAFLLSLFGAVLGTSTNKAALPMNLMAFFAALLFALHPISTYAAGYLVQRTTVMATLFSLLALLFYLQGSIKNKQKWLWLSVPLYFMAVFSKEHAIMLPAVLVALTLLLHDDWILKIKQRLGIYSALFGIALIVVLARKGILGSVYEINAAEMFEMSDIRIAYPLSVMTQTWLFFKYIWLWILPNPEWMSIDMRENFANALFSPYLIAVICFLAWGVASFWLMLRRGRLGLVGFGLFFPWLMFFTEFSSVRIQEVFVLYRSYLWAPGIFCLLPVIFSKMNRRMAAFLLSALGIAMLPISMDRLATLSHPILLWDDAEKLIKGRTDLPGAYRIYYNRGSEFLFADALDSAITDLNHSITLRRRFPRAYGNLGVAYFQKGNWKKAVESFSKAREMMASSENPMTPHYAYGRAQAYEKMGEFDKAQVDYQESCRLVKRGCEKLR